MESAQTHSQSEQYGHPIDMLEQLAVTQQWPCERNSHNDMSLSLAGEHGEYEVAVSWREDLCGLHFACILGIKAPQAQRARMLELLAHINERLWLGHFDIWKKDGTLLFRNTMLLGGSHMNLQQCDQLVAHGFHICEQFLPAFNYLLWSACDVQTALDACLLETKGDA